MACSRLDRNRGCAHSCNSNELYSTYVDFTTLPIPSLAEGINICSSLVPNAFSCITEHDGSRLHVVPDLVANWGEQNISVSHSIRGILYYQYVLSTLPFPTSCVNKAL